MKPVIKDQIEFAKDLEHIESGDEHIVTPEYMISDQDDVKVHETSSPLVQSLLDRIKALTAENQKLRDIQSVLLPTATEGSNGCALNKFYEGYRSGWEDCAEEVEKNSTVMAWAIIHKQKHTTRFATRNPKSTGTPVHADEFVIPLFVKGGTVRPKK